MMQYKNFNYEQKQNGKWKVLFPNGHKVVREFADEAAVKAFIDELRQAFGDNR